MIAPISQPKGEAPKRNKLQVVSDMLNAGVNLGSFGVKLNEIAKKPEKK